MGNPAVQQMVNGTLFQLYCHLRSGLVAAPGPGGLSASLWIGKVFWDANFWMFPVLCPLQPELGRCIVEYRHRTLPGAIRNAQAEGYKGAQIGWESGEFGEQVTGNVFRHERHVNTAGSITEESASTSRSRPVKPQSLTPRHRSISRSRTVLATKFPS